MLLGQLHNLLVTFKFGSFTLPSVINILPVIETRFWQAHISSALLFIYLFSWHA